MYDGFQCHLQIKIDNGTIRKQFVLQNNCPAVFTDDACSRLWIFRFTDRGGPAAETNAVAGRTAVYMAAAVFPVCEKSGHGWPVDT